MRGIVTAGASAIAVALAATGALAQTQGGGQGAAKADDQRIQQEQAPQKGAQLTVSPATVRSIKQALNQAGYDPGSVDGSWDKNAQTAVQNYQQAQGLEPTGSLNLATLQALGINLNQVMGGGQGQKQSQAKGQSQNQQYGQEQARQPQQEKQDSGF